jgi:hypothetical protein
MHWRRVTAMISNYNDYSRLKWPITIASVLTTILAFILLLSFRSHVWFTYEIIEHDNNTSSLNTTVYSRLIQYGSLGLWTMCIAYYDNAQMKCETWTQETRPDSFNIVILLVSCALFLSNLTVFPSWATSILILYNTNNRYIRHIVAFVWILLILTLFFSFLLLTTIVLITLTKFFSPSVFVIGKTHLLFSPGQGLFYAGFGKSTILFIYMTSTYMISYIFQRHYWHLSVLY